MLTNSQFLLLMIMKIYIQCFESIFTLLHFKGNEGSSHSYNLLYITPKTSTSIICIQKFDYYVHTTVYVLNRKYKLLVTASKNQYSRPLLTAPYCCSYRTTAAHEEPGKVYCLHINSCCEKRIKPSTQVHNVNSSYYCNK